jgi:hypothetical protein
MNIEKYRYVRMMIESINIASMNIEDIEKIKRMKEEEMIEYLEKKTYNRYYREKIRIIYDVYYKDRMKLIRKMKKEIIEYILCIIGKY